MTHARTAPASSADRRTDSTSCGRRTRRSARFPFTESRSHLRADPPTRERTGPSVKSRFGHISGTVNMARSSRRSRRANLGRPTRPSSHGLQAEEPPCQPPARLSSAPRAKVRTRSPPRGVCARRRAARRCFRSTTRGRSARSTTTTGANPTAAASDTDHGRGIGGSGRTGCQNSPVH